MTPAAAAAPAGLETIGSLIKIIGIDRAFDLLSSTTAGALKGGLSPNSGAPISAGVNNSNYFLGANPYLAREGGEPSQVLVRTLLQKLGFPIEDYKTTSEATKEIEDTTERQATSLSSRLRQEISLKGELEQQLEALKGEIGLKRAGLERGFDVTLKGYDLEQERQRQIGAIEQQKVSSTFDAAQRLLDSTITQLYGATPYARNPDLQQVATPV